MKIEVHPADEGGCGHYRLIWPARALSAQGHDVVLGDNLASVHYSGPWSGEFPPPDVHVIGVERPDADVLVFQRPLKRAIAELIPHLQAQGVAVVVEVDDDFDAIAPSNPAFRTSHPATSPERNRDHLRRACQLADLVTVSTPSLARRYGAHGRVMVLANCVPEDYLAIERTDWRDRLGVGWSGSVLTHPGDLEVTRGAVGRVVEQAGAQVCVVGTGRGVDGALGVDDEILATGWLEIADYPLALACIDVGIVPLADTRFNAAKSWLKGLEMAALGVPFVASPLPEYQRLAALGAGELASKPKDWARLVGGLLADEGRRDEARERGREVARSLTIEANAWRWMQAWVEAAANRVLARIPA